LRFIIKTLLILILSLFSVGFSVGCATTQSERFLKSDHRLNETHKIAKVPFVEQSAGQCGPATLAMALQFDGQPISVDELVPQVFTPQMKGSLQGDLISAARRHGMMAIEISGFSSLFTEVAAGHPVIVFENLGLSWAPTWHYALVHGYDFKKKEIILHSGPDREKHERIRNFDRAWGLGQYWGLVVLRPSELAASVGEIEHVSAAAALEKIEKFDEAALAYNQILTRWPQSLGALIGLANLAYQRKEFQSAIDYLKTATEYHPDAAAAWHNLAIAQGRLEQKSEAHISALKAVQLALPKVKTSYAENLKNWL
jgi:hypothetical protein